MSQNLSGEGTALAISAKCGTPLLVVNITTNRGWAPLTLHHAVATKILTLLRCSSQPSPESNLRYLASEPRWGVSLTGGVDHERAPSLGRELAKQTYCIIRF